MMRDFYEDPRWRTGARPALKDFAALVERYTGPEFRDALVAFVESEGTPDLVAAFAAVGVEVERRGGGYQLPEDLLERIM